MQRATPVLIFLAALTITTLAKPRSATADAPLPRAFSVQSATCPTGDAPACAYTDTATIYVEPGQGEFVLKHELGHLFDYQRLNDGDRHWFTRMLGLTGAWSQGAGLEGLLSPAERFADAYAACALGWRPDRGHWEDSYGYEPTPTRHRKICAAINRIGNRA